MPPSHRPLRFARDGPFFCLRAMQKYWCDIRNHSSDYRNYIFLLR
jgi:hypothetical protein